MLQDLQNYELAVEIPSSYSVYAYPMMDEIYNCPTTVPERTLKCESYPWVVTLDIHTDHWGHYIQYIQ